MGMADEKRPDKGRVQKKNKKKIMENSILGGEGGGQQGSFSISNFFLIFFAPNGLKIIFRH